MRNPAKVFGLLATLAAIAFAFPSLLTAAPLKPFPAGIVDLPASVDADNPIGPIYSHPWQNVNVDGVRIRTGWENVEVADSVYNWVEIDECLTLAATSGKFIGLGVVAGIKSPPWLMGADSFTNGSTTVNVATLTSPTANFVPEDVGRIIDSDKFPAGTTIVSRSSATVAQTSAAALASKAGNAGFSVLARRPGVPFRTITAPDEGVMPVPWDPVVLAKWKTFIRALGARYDGNPRLRYLNMGGFSQTGEAYLATQQPDVDYFNAKAVAAGYSPTTYLSAGMVAWEALVKEVVDTYMVAFPTTPVFITLARPFPESQGGTKAVNEIVAWAVDKYPGRFGIMNSQLHATSAPGYFANARIYENRLNQPTGAQFLCSTGSADRVARLCNSTPWGSDPLLSPFAALNATFNAGIAIGAKFIEVYELDVQNSAYQTTLATQGAALKSESIPEAPTNLRIL